MAWYQYSRWLGVSIRCPTSHYSARVVLSQIGYMCTHGHGVLRPVRQALANSS